MSKVDFINNALAGHDGVKEFEWLTDDIILIKNDDYSNNFMAGILWEQLVEPRHVEPLIKHNVSFISNIPKVGLWSGAAIRICEASHVAWGRFGALLSACGSRDDPRNHVDKEIGFARTALEQHSNVAALEFIFHKLFKLYLRSGSSVRVALVNDYDITSTEVRSAKKWLGDFDLILKNNPNGRITADANSAAESIGVKIMKIGDLMKHIASL
ncbi:MAG: hypothetical protein ACRC6I_17200 [Paracoccaceae bacterium]